MRFLLEIALIGALLYAGWEKPFREQLPDNLARFVGVTPTPAPTPVRRVATRAAAPVPAAGGGAWMWNSTNRTALQTPAPAAPVATPAASRPGSWLFDPNHHSPLDPPHKSATPH